MQLLHFSVDDLGNLGWKMCRNVRQPLDPAQAKAGPCRAGATAVQQSHNGKPQAHPRIDAHLCLNPRPTNML